MPLRALPLFNCPRLRLFHASAFLRNHYETLQLSPNATPKSIKESFYALSKLHHPDRNPSDPSASERFIKINDAYATLGVPAKKAAYDRDVMTSSSSSSPPPRGSYSSANPAGGRPASGLSRRRTQFRGPPTSFYRSGGWGEHTAKRAAAQNNGAPGATEPSFDENLGGAVGGMGPGQKPWGHGNDVPHFDKEGHYGTHENIEMWRRTRRTRRLSEDEQAIKDFGRGSMGMGGQLLVIAGVLVIGTIVPVMIDQLMSAGKPRKKER